MHVRKEEWSQISGLNFHLNQKKKSKFKPKQAEERNVKGIINWKIEKQQRRISETQKWFDEIKKIDKPLAILIRTKREKT